MRKKLGFYTENRVEEALKSAVDGDYSLMNKLLEVLKNPYDYSKDLEYYRELSKKTNIPYRTYCGT